MSQQASIDAVIRDFWRIKRKIGDDAAVLERARARRAALPQTQCPSFRERVKRNSVLEKCIMVGRNSNASLLTAAVLAAIPLLTNAADWHLLSELPTAGMTLYVATDTIKPTNGFVDVWTMRDWNTKQFEKGSKYIESHEYQSSKTLLRLDCINHLLGVGALADYSGNMGSGELTYSWAHTAIELEPVVAETIGGAQLDFVCSSLKAKLKSFREIHGIDDPAACKGDFFVTDPHKKCSQLQQTARPSNRRLSAVIS